MTHPDAAPLSAEELHGWLSQPQLMYPYEARLAATISTLSATVAALTEERDTALAQAAVVVEAAEAVFEYFNSGKDVHESSVLATNYRKARDSAASALAYAQRLKDAEAANRAAINMVCDFAIKCGLATGHAETMAELLDELRPQIKEQTERMVAAETRLADAEAEVGQVDEACKIQAANVEFFRQKFVAAEARALPAGTVAVCEKCSWQVRQTISGVVMVRSLKSGSECLCTDKACPIRSAGVAS